MNRAYYLGYHMARHGMARLNPYDPESADYAEYELGYAEGNDQALVAMGF